MKIHLIVAHHDKNSFNFALHNKAIEALTSSGVKFFESDLYGIGFNPAASYHDAINLTEENKQNLAKAQRWALENSAFTSEVAEEQNKVASAEIIILQFPLWWWSFPAILKGWIDRVLSSGFAYGKNAQLSPKKVMYSITTGGASNDSELNYYNKKIDGLYQDVFGFMGWEIIPAYIAHGVQQKNELDRKTLLDGYVEHLKKYVL